MSKILNTLLLLSVLFFIFGIFKYYSSNKNINIKNHNRSNIDEILKGKIKDLPILINDTNNVIEFNDSFELEINEGKKRSFWDLLKKK
tara:strand:- start:644 stop:907 length:264 start_codon:yes stop_codon:yes gene_type:complete